MPAFRYKAATPGGEVNEGELQAGSETEVIEKLHHQGYIPIRVQETGATPQRKGQPSQGQASWLRWRRTSGLKQQEIQMLTAELARLLKAGLTLDRALSILIEITDEATVAPVLRRIQDAIRGGATFADALEAQQGTFSAFYTSMVRAGEAGGALAEVLARLADYMERARALRQSVTSALIYPTILVGVSGVSIIILLTYVVPQFEQLFEDAGKALPLATQVVITVADGLQHYGWAFGLAGVVLFLWGRRQFRNPSTRLRWDRRLLKLPLVGDLIGKVEMARLARTLSTLLHNGVPLLSALFIVRDTMTNHAMAATLGSVAEGVRGGQSLADPLRESGVFPQLAVQMIRVGEETGQLDHMLMQVADTYDAEVQATINRQLALLEPILILGLGIIIAGIIMSILVAILSMNQLAM